MVFVTSQSQKILSDMQVRKSAKEKREFRAWLTAELKAAGWTVEEEHGFFAGHNVIAGDPEKARILYTAHYDTQAVLPFPNFITPRNVGLYIAYQLPIVLGFLVLIALAEGLTISAFRALGAKELLPVAAPLVSIVICFLFVWWMFFGKANRHTANDNTSGVITLLEVALTLPAEDRDKVCLVFFDNEERGMLGSAHFAGKRKRVKSETLVLNFDCVSDGDSIQFFATKKLRAEETTLKTLENAFKIPENGAKTDATKGQLRTTFAPKEDRSKEVEVCRQGGIYPSDNVSFKRACGICALKKKGKLYYMDRIHTAKDTVFMEENIELLRAGCLRLVKGLEA